MFFVVNKKFLTVFLHGRITLYYSVLHPIRFALKNNFLANITVIGTAIMNVLCIFYVVSLDTFCNEMGDLIMFAEQYSDKELLRIVPENLTGFLKDLQHVQTYVILGYAIASAVIFVSLFIVG